MNSGRQVTVYNQDPALRGQDRQPVGQLLRAGHQLQRRGHHGQQADEQQLVDDRRRQLRQDHGDIYATLATGDLNNPNFTFRRGLVGNDVPYSYRMSGVYELPYQISSAATAQYYKGFPEMTTVSVGEQHGHAHAGHAGLTVEPRGTTRLPAVTSLDVSVRKTLEVIGTTSIEPRVDFYNLTNAATILGRVTQLGPTYGRVSSIQRGRLIKLGLSMEF